MKNFTGFHVISRILRLERAEMAEIYMAPVNTSVDGEWTKVASGEDNITVTFTLSDGSIHKIGKLFEKVKIFDSEIFAEWVREMHRLPDIRTESWVLRSLNVTQFGLTWNGNVYKYSWFDFADNSCYSIKYGYDRNN